jgi:DNA-binding transcriptional regulator of glucitol operon
VRQRWLSRRAVLLHLALAVFVAGCTVLTWWQTDRALSGNTLSWFYAFEWPAFAVLAGFAWWSAVHDDPASVAARKAVMAAHRDDGPAALPPPAVLRAGEEDPELAAYNRYLAALAASGRRKTWRHP